MSAKRVRTPPNFDAIASSLKALAPAARIERLRRHEELRLTADVLAEGYREATTDVGRMAVLNGIAGAEQRASELNALPHIERNKKSQAQRRTASASAGQERARIARQRAMLARKLAGKVSTTLKQQGKSAVARKVKELASKEMGDDAKHLSGLSLRRLATLIFETPKTAGSHRQ